MGLENRDYYRDDQSPGLTLRPPQTAVMALILINVAVWLVTIFFTRSTPNGGTTYPLIDLGEMQVQTLWQPLQWYRLLTSGFLHDPHGVMHILGNMFVLFFFGRDIEGIYGKRNFVAFYLSTIVLASLGWALFTQLFRDVSPSLGCIGASGGVSAVLMLYILHFPKRMILLFFVLPVPAWVLGVFWVGGDIFGAFDNNSEIAHSSHLIGFLCGYLFFQTGWTLDRAVPRGFSLPSFKRKPKLRVHDPDARGEDTLDTEADRVLSKLHNEGADSLTPREKKVLEEYSRRMQQKLR